MPDPYARFRADAGDPGPTPTDVLAFFDGHSGGSRLGARGVWNRYCEWLFSFCLRRRLHHADAQDAVQEVMAALENFRCFRRAHPGAPLRPWMVSVLRRKLVDLERDRAGRPETIPLERLEALTAMPIVPMEHDGDGDLGATPYGPLLERVRRRCAEPRNWLAFRGMALQGKTAAEVSAELEMDPADVYKAKSRGLGRLREEIGAEAAPLRPEFDEWTWSLFHESAVIGAPPGVVARRLGVSEADVQGAVARVLRRFGEYLRARG